MRDWLIRQPVSPFLSLGGILLEKSILRPKAHVQKDLLTICSMSG